MSAWLKKGDLDRGGHLVKKDKFIADNVRLTFTETSLIIRSHNLPNHPTAVFPDRWRALDGNPNYIQEQNQTWSIPLEPRENPDHVAMEESNANRALPGGPIGVAVNGVIFFNPFDADSVEAIWRLDRCCGHPSPGFEYHYHKYPVCVKSPWTDDGKAIRPDRFRLRRLPDLRPVRSGGRTGQGLAQEPAQRVQHPLRRSPRLALPRHAGQVSPPHRRLLGLRGRSQPHPPAAPDLAARAVPDVADQAVPADRHPVGPSHPTSAIARIDRRSAACRSQRKAI